MSEQQERYRAELRRLLGLDSTAIGTGNGFLCVYEPSFHPEWSVRVSMASGTVRVSALDRSAWAWFNSIRDGSWSDPVKGWVEPGTWNEDVELLPTQMDAIREAFPPRAPERVPVGIDGMYVGFAIPRGGRWEWRYFWSQPSDGARLARMIAEAVATSARTAQIREAAEAALRHLTC